MSGTPDRSDPGPTTNATAVKPGIPDYDLVRVVGRGSYGDVWLARGVTGVWRAIKVVWRERFATAEPFEREFRGLKEFAEISLGESSQMALLHVGRNDAAGFFYYVMELADDAERDRHIDPTGYVPLTLAEMRRRRGRIPADECVRIGVELARSLASLHRRRLVHRDVKPSNVIFVSGLPKLADVGLVAPSASAQTFVGTEGYVPPEGPGAPSADVFALAKVLYELSTGHDRQEFPRLPADLASLPDRATLLELNEIFLRACGPSPGVRYRDGAALLADLAALSAGASLRTRRFAAFAVRVAVALVVVAAVGWGGWRLVTRPSPAPPIVAGVFTNSVAVLPFANATGDPEQDYFADGIADEVLHALEREQNLRVTGSWASAWVKGRNLMAIESAKRLRAEHLVEGTVLSVAPRIRLEVRLTRGADGVSAPLGTFERDEKDVFALEDDVARAVAGKLLSRVSMPPPPAPPTNNLAAYREFLRGRAVQVSGIAGAAKAIEHFRRAKEIDEGFAAAWARFADAQRTQATANIHGAWDHGEALAAAETALKLRPDLPLVWTVRGFIVGVGGRQPAQGLRDLDQAEQLGGPTAETRMTRFLISFYASETMSLRPLAREAVARNPENIERLTVLLLVFAYIGDYLEADRLSAQAGDWRGRVYLRRNWRGAEAALRLADRVPRDHPAALALRVEMLAELGRRDEAARLLENAVSPSSWETFAAAGLFERARPGAEAALPNLQKAFAAFPPIPRNETELIPKEDTRSRLILAEIVLGHHEAALEQLDNWRRESEQRMPNRRSAGPFIMNLARGYAMLGRNDDAIAMLERFVADGRTIGYDLHDSAVYAGLRGVPRFVELRQQAESWAARQPDPAD